MLAIKLFVVIDLILLIMDGYIGVDRRIPTAIAIYTSPENSSKHTLNVCGVSLFPPNSPFRKDTNCSIDEDLNNSQPIVNTQIAYICPRMCGRLSKNFLNIRSIIKKIPWYIPQRRKIKSAPCQNPQSVKTINRFRQVTAMPLRFPPIGI